MVGIQAPETRAPFLSGVCQTTLSVEPRLERLHERMLAKMIEDLRRLVLAPPATSERFYAVFMDKNRSVLGHAAMGEGHHCAVCLRPRELFSRALSVGTESMVIAHNHPSGDCRPSVCDVETTSHIAGLANALEIELLDHLIFTHDCTYSMRGGGEL